MLNFSEIDDTPCDATPKETAAFEALVNQRSQAQADFEEDGMPFSLERYAEHWNRCWAEATSPRARALVLQSLAGSRSEKNIAKG